MNRPYPSNKPAARTRKAIGFRPHAARFLILGHILILVALCEFAARLHGGSRDALLYIEDFFTSAMGAWIIMWGAGILLDYLERTERKESSKP